MKLITILTKDMLIVMVPFGNTRVLQKKPYAQKSSKNY